MAGYRWAAGYDPAALAVALGCGLLIGIERERRKGSGARRALAGLRVGWKPLALHEQFLIK